MNNDQFWISCYVFIIFSCVLLVVAKRLNGNIAAFMMAGYIYGIAFGYIVCYLDGFNKVLKERSDKEKLS